jgi:hypothetical protein
VSDQKVYIAIRRGVYRHEVVGAFTELDRAIAAGHESVQTEHDHYHDVEVLACALNGGEEELIGEVTAVWEHIPQERPPGACSWSSHRKEYKGTRWTGAAPGPRI